VSATEPAGFAGKRRTLALAAGVAALDLWSKAAVFARLAPGERLDLVGDWLAFHEVMNRGIMWGKFPEYSPLVRVLRIVAVIVVVAMIRSTSASARLVHLALGLVLGGAVGNIYDGFVHAGVRDFIEVDLGVRHFDPFPIFNVADSAICVGVGLLALGMLRGSDPEEQTAAG